MKIKNITDSVRKCWNRRTGWIMLVGPGEIVEAEKILFDKRAFIIVKSKKSRKKTSSSRRSKIKTHKEEQI